MAAIALTRILTECNLTFTPSYLPHYAPCLKVILQLNEGIIDESAALPTEENDDFEIEETSGFVPAFSQLAHAVKTDNDPFPQIQPKVLLTYNLQQASKAHPGIVSLLIESYLFF